MKKYRIRQILFVLLLAVSATLHYASRAKIIDIQEGNLEFLNLTLFMFCGVLALVLHFLRTDGRAWYFGLIGLSLFIMPFEDHRYLNIGLLFLTSTFLIIFVETVLTRIQSGSRIL